MCEVKDILNGITGQAGIIAKEVISKLKSKK